MAAFFPSGDSYTTTTLDYNVPTWSTTNTGYFAEQPRRVSVAWENYRDRDRLSLALLGAGSQRELQTVRPRRYLTTAARAPHRSACCPLRGAREFAYKRPRKAGLIAA